MTIDQLRQIAGQSRRRAMHCPICNCLLVDDPAETFTGRLRQLCNGHSRGRYTASHQATLRLLADVADLLVAEMERVK